jgi:tRNA A37 threonylcarbamoyladenosine modification protein TsaB
LSYQQILTQIYYRQYSKYTQACLYFYWQKDKVFVRPTAQVESVQAKRDAEKLAAESLAHCIDNLSKNIFDEQDEPYLKEIARVALNQSKTAKMHHLHHLSPRYQSHN